MIRPEFLRGFTRWLGFAERSFVKNYGEALERLVGKLARQASNSGRVDSARKKNGDRYVCYQVIADRFAQCFTNTCDCGQ